MERNKHYFMTCAALVFLGLILVKPGTAFYPAGADASKECWQSDRQSRQCKTRTPEYQLNMSNVKYEYN
jgi:hypothetical protein